MSDLTPCEHQVGGWHNGTQSRVLKDKKEGLVVKPVKLNANRTYDPKFDPSTYIPNNSQEEELIPVCSNELDFYQYLQTSTDPEDVTLKSLIPEFHGSRMICTEDGKVTPHLLLGDLAHGMKNPCVADIKMGRSFTYPGKDFTKQAKKYVTRDELGYCLCGMRVYDPDTGASVLELRPDACKQLDRTQVFHSLEKFCQRGHPVSHQLRDSVVAQLHHIHQWFLSQRKYRLRCSSVLVVYDAAALATQQRSYPTGAIQDASISSESQNTAGSKQPHSTSEPQNTTGTTQPHNTSGPPHGNLTLISSKPQTPVSTSGRPQDMENTPAEHQTLINTSSELHCNKNTPPSSSQTLGNTSNDTDTLVVAPDTKSTLEKSYDNSVRVKVKMIDFAHVLYAFGEKDDNYIFGLEKLIEFFSMTPEGENS